MKTIILPTPKYQFGQEVYVIGSETRTKYAPCHVCKGEGKVAVQGWHGTTECPACKGRGHHYGESTKETVWFVAGRLTIRGCSVEVVENPKPESPWFSDNDRLTYRGEIHWTDAVSEDKRGWNVFNEVRCFESLATVEAEVEQRNHKDC